MMFDKFIFCKINKEYDFELIYNIQANKSFLWYSSLNLPILTKKIYKYTWLFDELKGESYSILNWKNSWRDW